MTKVKICGLKTPEDIAAVNAVHPDYAGFVFYEKSRRNVSCETAAALSRCLLPEICPVGVFVGSTAEKIADLYRQGIIRAAQLYGQEDNAFILRLRETAAAVQHPGQPPLCIIKAFLVSGEDPAQAATSGADYVLLDSGYGSGEAFEWGRIRQFGRPYFLAGGLTQENVKEAIRTLHPYAVDVSSGVETAGSKDPAKIKAFTEAVRGEE